MPLDFDASRYVDAVRGDEPTRPLKSASPSTTTPAAKRSRSKRAADTGRAKRAVPAPPASAAGPGELDDLLGTPQKNFSSRFPEGLWDAFRERADEIGVELRPLLTDAILAALELTAEEHRTRAINTRNRERYAVVRRQAAED